MPTPPPTSGGEALGAVAMERARVADMVPAAYNPRTISDRAREGLRASLREFGLVQPIVVNRRTGHVVGGHQRLAILAEQGIEATDVVVVDLSLEREKALNIALNSPAIAGEFTADLQTLLGEIADVDSEIFHDLCLDDLVIPQLEMDDDASAADDDAVPEPPKDPITKRGELWQLGEHRLLCGDCRERADVERVLAGDVVNVAFTSPPYADRREYDPSSGFRPIPPDDYVEWFRPVADNVAAVIASDGSWFVNIKPGVRPDGLSTELYVLDLVLAHARLWGWNFATEFCWERCSVPKMVRRRFKNEFEPIYQFARGDWKMRPESVRHASDSVPTPLGPGCGNTDWSKMQGHRGAFSGRARKRKSGTSGTLSNVQDVPGPSDAGEYLVEGLAYPGNRLPTFRGSHEALGHSAAFPVGLPAWFARAFSDPGDVILDPFGGSGSTIIAAHREDRRGRTVEISPAYCDVIIERWQTATGGKAKRL